MTIKQTGLSLKGVILLTAAFTTDMVSAADQCLKIDTAPRKSCADLSELQNFPPLEKGQCATVTFSAKDKNGVAKMRLLGNNRYQITIDKREGEQWCDASIVTTHEGWHHATNGNSPRSATCPVQCSEKYCPPGSNKGTLGPAVRLDTITRLFVKMSRWLRRHPESDLFSLFVSLQGKGYDRETQYSDPYPVTPDVDVQLCAYANDVFFMYGNNSGILRLRITNESD